uniref:Fatty acid hydroxylase domain-containing protein n=1 Tax=Strombidium inclinatum TaxID=197538 RepID=A0A7S3IH95_9SPIT|mmetsp:Transcript_17220/g.26598  ORF Transcript_17220/g.26598 Transcript_17220/m.26598 type:complete len:214 (+) Transcript_17220:543-1184(+)
MYAALRQFLFNATVINYTAMMFGMWVYGWKLRWNFDPNELPSNWKIFFQVLFCIFVEDTLFHHAHKLFHVKHKYLPLYQWVHKRHHEFKMPVSISAQYAHPVEHIFANILPTLAGPLILGKHLHFWMIISWGVVRMMDTHEGHSGYDFPWSIFRLIPFGTGPAYHDFHHSANVGNYSSFTSVWDTFWDTNTEFWEEYFPLGPRRSEGEHEKKE